MRAVAMVVWGSRLGLKAAKLGEAKRIIFVGCKVVSLLGKVVRCCDLTFVKRVVANGLALVRD
jgi:hypothetical protein